MSNKVWVRWKDSTGEAVLDRVTKLEDDSIVADLRRELVMQQNLTNAGVVPATLKVLRNGSEALEADKELKEYFVTADKSSDKPGKTKKAALLIAFQPPQHPAIAPVGEPLMPYSEDTSGPYQGGDKWNKINAWKDRDGPPLKRHLSKEYSWLPLSQIPALECKGPSFVSQEGWLYTLVNRVADLTKKQDLPDG